MLNGAKASRPCHIRVETEQDAEGDYCTALSREACALRHFASSAIAQCIARKPFPLSYRAQEEERERERTLLLQFSIVLMHGLRKCAHMLYVYADCRLILCNVMMIRERLPERGAGYISDYMYARSRVQGSTNWIFPTRPKRQFKQRLLSNTVRPSSNIQSCPVRMYSSSAVPITQSGESSSPVSLFLSDER